MRRTFLAVVVAIAGGCGGGGDGGAQTPVDSAPRGPDLSGWYRVTSMTTGPCGGPLKPAAFPPAYVFLDPGMFGDVIVLRSCTEPTREECRGTLFYDFRDATDDGRTAEGGTAFHSAGCTLTWERTRATLVGGDLTVRSLQWRVVREVPPAECTLAAAKALTEPCTNEVALSATRM